MPLVTRSSEQGNLFKQDLEPGGWLNGDLWSDTTANVLKLNVGGTASEIGGLELTFDNIRVSLTASQTDATTPASGESDSGIFILEQKVGGDTIDISGDSGSAFMAQQGPILGTTMGTNNNNIPIMSIGNSTGRYRYTATADVGTRIFHQIITTMS